MDAALADGDLDAVERLLARLEALGPGHRPPFVSADALRARALARRGSRRRRASTWKACCARRSSSSSSSGCVVHETTTRLDLRDWLRTQGRDAEADEVAAAVRRSSAPLGAVALLERL